MDASVMCTIFSITTAGCFRRFFPNDPGKLALADLIDITVNARKVMQSRVIEDEKDNLKCAFRFHLEEQTHIVDKFVVELKTVDWYSRDGPSPGKWNAKGPRLWTNLLYFPGGAALTVSATKQLHKDNKVSKTG